MIISIIVAVAENGIIGNGGQMPWHIREDLKRFKRITSGHPVVMGRKTFESIGSRPLPDRTNIVVSRNPEFVVPEGVVLVESLDILERFGATDEEVFIIGGGEIYRQAMPMADKLYLTRVAVRPAEGDTRFPAIEPDTWRMVWHEAHPAAADGSVPAFEFVDLVRVR